MQQTLTAKLQIFPKPSDRQLLFDTTKAYSAACTYVSDYVHANHTPLNIFHIQKATYPDMSGIFRAALANGCQRYPYCDRRVQICPDKSETAFGPIQ